MFALAAAAWLASFLVLARLGTWAPFAVAGAAGVAVALLLEIVPGALFRPSGRKIALGLFAGLLMVGFTRATYAVVAPAVPMARAASERLFQLLQAGAFSLGTRAGLMVVIASSEEVLFRGALPGTPAGRQEHRLRGLSRSDILRIVAFAAGYALAALPLGSLLLVLVAFICGVAWGAMRMATGSLVVPIIAHVVWDLGVLVVWPLVALQS